MLKPAQVQAIPTATLDVFHKLETTLGTTAASALRDPLAADRAALRAAFAASSYTAKRSVDEIVVSTMTEAARTSLLADEKLYEAARVAGLISPYASLSESAAFAALLKDGVATSTTMLNLVRTSAEQAVYAGFLDALDGAMLSVASGQEALDAAIRVAVKKVAEQTTMVSYVSEGGRRVEQSLYGAVRRAVLTGTHQTTLRMQEARLREVGAEYVEITAHGGARPDHEVWQGTIIRLDELEEVTGYGSGEGLGGWNCAHDFFPYFPGIMEPTDQSALEARDNEEDYELSQRQRECERNIRKYQGRADIYKAGGIKDEADRNKALATKWRKEADSVAAKRNGARRVDREVGDKFAKVTTTKATSDARFFTDLPEGAAQKAAREYALAHPELPITIVK